MFKRLIAGVLLGIVAGVGVAGVASASVPGDPMVRYVPVDAKTWSKVKESPWCSMLRPQPGYSYMYQGSKVTVPSGARLLKYDVYGDGYKRGSVASDRVCRVLVEEYWEHKFGW